MMPSGSHAFLISAFVQEVEDVAGVKPKKHEENVITNARYSRKKYLQLAELTSLFVLRSACNWISHDVELCR
jgi:hypothetical protein